MIDIDYRDDDYKESGTAKAKNSDSGKMDPEDASGESNNINVKKASENGEDPADKDSASEKDGTGEAPEEEIAGEVTDKEVSDKEDPGKKDPDKEGTDQEDPDKEDSDTEGPDKEESGEETSDEEASGEETPAGREQKGRSSFFGRKKKDKEAEKFQKQIDDLTDLLKRNRAEFDNFRKRTEKEKSGMYIIGARDIVEKMLPVVDSFERGLAQAPEGDAFADGMKLIYKQLMTALEEAGVKPIEAVGKEFDPSFHNAVMHVEDAEAGDNIVVEEFQKGYTYKDSVVRHSMVKVAN